MAAQKMNQKKANQGSALELSSDCNVESEELEQFGLY